MTDDFEQDLSVALKEAAPQPPRDLDPLVIIRSGAGRGSSRWVTPLLAALVVAAVVGVVVWVTGGGRQHHTVATTAVPGPNQRPADIVGDWRLIDLEGMSGAAHTKPVQRLVFDFRADGFIGVGTCGAAVATVTATHLAFRQQFVSGTPADCAHLNMAQSKFLFGRVLLGTVSWSVSGDHLTIESHGAAAVFARVGAPVSGPALGTVVVHVGLYGGPARPSGAMALSNAPAADQTVTAVDAAGHRFAVRTNGDGNAVLRLPPGRYTISTSCGQVHHLVASVDRAIPVRIACVVP